MVSRTGLCVSSLVFAFLLLPSAAAQDTLPPSTHVYHRVPDIPAERTSLDVYPLEAGSRQPVVIFVHGGGWVQGDKANLQRAPAFEGFFRDRELVLVSINYRLLRHADSPSATFRDQPTDVAAAVRWVHDNIAGYGGDPNRIFLLGYSAGAHIVALVGTDERYLEQVGLSPASLSGIVSWDVSAYDVPRAVREGPDLGVPGAAVNLPRVFGSDSASQADASPVNFVASGKRYPPFLVVYAGIFNTAPPPHETQTLSKVQSEAFAEALTAAGGFARLYGEMDRTHTSLPREFGAAGDGVTAETQSFLTRFSLEPDD